MKLSQQIEHSIGVLGYQKTRGGVHKWAKKLQHRSLRRWIKNPRNFELKPKYNQYVGWEL